MSQQSHDVQVLSRLVENLSADVKRLAETSRESEARHAETSRRLQDSEARHVETSRCLQELKGILVEILAQHTNLEALLGLREAYRRVEDGAMACLAPDGSTTPNKTKAWSALVEDTPGPNSKSPASGYKPRIKDIMAGCRSRSW